MEIILPWALDGVTLFEGLRKYVLPNAFGCSLKAPVGTPCQIHNVKIEASESPPCQDLRVECSLEFEHPQDILPLVWSTEDSGSFFLNPQHHVPLEKDTQLPAVASDTKKPQWQQNFHDIHFDGQRRHEQWTDDGRWSVTGFIKLLSPLNGVARRPSKPPMTSRLLRSLRANTLSVCTWPYTNTLATLSRCRRTKSPSSSQSMSPGWGWHFLRNAGTALWDAHQRGLNGLRGWASRGGRP